MRGTAKDKTNKTPATVVAVGSAIYDKLADTVDEAEQETLREQIMDAVAEVFRNNPNADPEVVKTLFEWILEHAFDNNAPNRKTPTYIDTLSNCAAASGMSGVSRKVQLAAWAETKKSYWNFEPNTATEQEVLDTFKSNCEL